MAEDLLDGYTESRYETVKITFWKRLLTSAYYASMVVLFVYGMALLFIVFYSICGLILNTLDGGFFDVIWSRCVTVAQAQIKLFDNNGAYHVKVWRIFALIDFFIFLWLVVSMPETKRVKRD